MTRTVLVVAAHPDDEILGCGGTLAKFVAAGHVVHSLILATGSRSRSDALPGEVEVLQAAGKEAAAVLGAQEPEFAGLPDNAMDTVPLLEVIRVVERVRDQVDPDLVYTHHANDLNVDHRITHEAVLTAFRPLPANKPVSIYAYETLSSTEWGVAGRGQTFRPNVFVDIAGYLNRKVEALTCYSAEMRDPPHPRSLDGVRILAKLRGMTAGVGVAEAFEAVRVVE